MIVFADREQRVLTRDLLTAIESATDETERLIRYGQLEAGILDELCPVFDGATALRLPESLTIKTPEGFAFYGVYPDQYRKAALRWLSDCRPSSAVVIGIRSIGSTLSMVVAEAIGCPVWRFTVRPHGHPFDRKLVLSEELEEQIRSRTHEWFLIVDEGPGLSGSSFASVAEKLSELGVPDQRIVFFPSHDPDISSFVSASARERWSKHRTYSEPSLPEGIVPAAAQDLSAGAWRSLVYQSEAEWPEVVPQNERRKFLHGDCLYKFSGLGHLGRSKLDRAEALRSFSPPPCGFEDGFLRFRWVPGRPATVADEELAIQVGRYLTHISAVCCCDQPVRYAELCEMIHVNTGVTMPDRLPEVEAEPVVAIDGRMFLHEWILTGNGYLKTDALDHHEDHFFPGCQPISWDAAATKFEMGLAPQQIHPFWDVGYLAFRIGYTNLFGQEGQEARYTAELERVVAALPESCKT